MSLEQRIYYGTITAMDEQVGRLWRGLEESGIEETSIFCSDNGPEVETSVDRFSSVAREV